MSTEQATLSRTLAGPYGLHVFGALMILVFAAFLWVFNFTTFF